MNFAYLAEYVLAEPDVPITPAPCELNTEWKNFEKELSKFKTEFAVAQRDLALAKMELLQKREDITHLNAALGCLSNPELKVSIENIIENYEIDSGINDLVGRCEELAGRVEEMRKVLKDTDAARYASFTCFVCMERPIDLFLDPCGHVICERCWSRTPRREGFSVPDCPGCRSRVRNAHKIFTLS